MKDVFMRVVDCHEKLHVKNFYEDELTCPIELAIIYLKKLKKQEPDPLDDKRGK